MTKIAAFLFSLVLHMPIAGAETLHFELFEVSDGKRGTLLASGVREYTVRDVRVEDRGGWKNKGIPVALGFTAGASIYPEKQIAGFGLWLKASDSFLAQLSDGGFSWDWFDLEANDVYRKLQGGGRVRVIRASAPNQNEIGAVEVLEDLALRVRLRPWWFFFSTEPTHHLVLKKGSVLRYAL